MTRRGDNYQHNKGSNHQYQKGKKNWEQQCDFCKLKGHVRRDCYRLNGYPADWKFKKKDNISTAYNAHARNAYQNVVPRNREKEEMLDKMTAKNLPRAPYMTGEQHDQILEMLDKDPP